MAKMQNMFKPSRSSKATPRGNSGYDNARENIDPHVKTKVVNAKEILINGVNIEQLFLKLDCSNDPIQDLEAASYNTTTITIAGTKVLHECNIDIVETATVPTTVYTGWKHTVDYEYNGIFAIPTFKGLDFNYNFNQVAGGLNPTLCVFDVDITTTGTVGGSRKFIDFAADFVQDKMIDMAFSGAGNAPTGVFKLVATSSDVGTGNLISCRTAAVITEAKNNKYAVGYQGYAQNNDTGGNGYAIGLQPVINASVNTKYNAAFQPLKINSNTKDRMFTIHNANFGHILMDRGGIAVTSSTVAELDTDNPFNHITDWTAADGCLGVEETLEVSGMSYLDGGVVFKVVAAQPGSPVEGQLIIDTTNNKAQVYADGAWRDLATW